MFVHSALLYVRDNTTVDVLRSLLIYIYVHIISCCLIIVTTTQLVRCWLRMERRYQKKRSNYFRHGKGKEMEMEM